MKRARKKRMVASKRPTWHLPKAVVVPPPRELAWWMFALLEKPKTPDQPALQAFAG